MELPQTERNELQNGQEERESNRISLPRPSVLFYIRSHITIVVCACEKFSQHRIYEKLSLFDATR